MLRCHKFLTHIYDDSSYSTASTIESTPPFHYTEHTFAFLSQENSVLGIFKRGLSKTRQTFFGRISQMFGNTDITPETWDDIEAMLVQADLGIETTQTVLEY